MDLFVRLADSSGYEVYQCKRLADLTPWDITRAVEKCGNQSKVARLAGGADLPPINAATL
jgi:hypothetical protein